MSKIIIAIREDQKETIQAVKLEDLSIETLETVVNNIKAGQTYTTKPGGKVILTHDRNHITTVNDGREGNNLESLPRF